MLTTRRQLLGRVGDALLVAAAVSRCGWVRSAAATQPARIEHGFANVGDGVRLHYARAGEDGGELLLFLHGFPDFWYMWRRHLVEFGADYLAVAPDLRGYNLSSKPAAVDAYTMPHLLADLQALLRHFRRDEAVLVGHDWGGYLSWVFTAALPERVRRLIVINGPHPSVFLREVTTSPDQNRASQYERLFREPGSEKTFSASGLWASEYAALQARGMLSEEDKAAYFEAWRQPGAIRGGLNWYRADPIEVPPPDQVSAEPPLLDLARHFFAGLPVAPESRSLSVRVPTLVIWGEQDQSLLPGLLDGLSEYVSDLTVHRIPEGSHMVVHEQPETITRLMRGFLQG